MRQQFRAYPFIMKNNEGDCTGKKEEMNLEITKLQKGEEKHWKSK